MGAGVTFRTARVLG